MHFVGSLAPLLGQGIQTPRKLPTIGLYLKDSIEYLPCVGEARITLACNLCLFLLLSQHGFIGQHVGLRVAPSKSVAMGLLGLNEYGGSW